MPDTKCDKKFMKSRKRGSTQLYLWRSYTKERWCPSDINCGILWLRNEKANSIVGVFSVSLQRANWCLFSATQYWKNSSIFPNKSLFPWDWNSYCSLNAAVLSSVNYSSISQQKKANTWEVALSLIFNSLKVTSIFFLNKDWPVFLESRPCWIK